MKKHSTKRVFVRRILTIFEQGEQPRKKKTNFIVFILFFL